MPLMFWPATFTFDGASFPDKRPRSRVMAMLCEHCSAFAKRISSLSPASFELKNRSIPRDYQALISEIQHPLPRASKLRSSAVNCALCSFIFRNVSDLHHSHQGSEELLDITDAPVEIDVWGGYLRPDEFKIHSCVIWIHAKKKLGASCWLYTNSEDIDGRSGQVFSNPPAPSGSVASLAWVEERLRHCLSNHENCRQGIGGTPLDPEPVLPTRILDLGRDGGCHVIHLVESAGARAVYTALSYCWGAPDQWPLRTTNDNLQQHKSGIAMKNLSKTYRDAIKVTRSLGIRYLWIDALCITQEDDCDWKHECELMGQYYEKAHLVIAASGAANSAEGCFLPHPSFDEVILPFYSEGSVVGSFKIALQPPSNSADPISSPLGDRAWATQEWWLSRRIVHFLADCMIWSCACADDYRPGIHQHGFPTDLEMYWDWTSIVSMYSGRSLSRPSDRLAAIQGLANVFKKTRQDEYVMGLWSGDLPTALLWKDGDGYGRTEDLSIFPSWTWASVAGAIECPWDMEEEPFEPMATISAILDDDRRLRIVGCMANGRFQPPDNKTLVEPGNIRARFRDVLDDLSNENGEHVGWGLLDESDDFVSEAEIHFLVLAEWLTQEQESQIPLYCCLLLEEVDPAERSADVSEPGIPTFRRRGLGVISEAAMEDTVSKEVDLI